MSDEFKFRTIIKTERLLLSPISLTDADDTFHIRSFREIYQWTIAGQWTLKSQATEWITTNLANPSSYNFSITLLPTDLSDATEKPLVIGSIGSARGEEIGYMFHPDYWGRGYATEALIGFIKTYFEKLPHAEFLLAKTDVSNKASRRVLEKVGFVHIEDEIFENPTLGPSPAIVYEIRRPKREEESTTKSNSDSRVYT
ncbi:acyl-CoA N-acyltransferase [Tothia fuscella]|uniref:Acyl-CoA N-acyltransferase n=1 Tax=Tothia fuscella TaxID=1048955 RepID=A0A9P4NJS5_9PEZI|nr:acyl-CoA N-acyltransferase [Tothia fuscella]